MLKIIYPGSFDPLTLGHIDLIQRACAIFDHVLVAIAENTGKRSLFTPQERMQIAKEALAEFANVEITLCTGLLTQFARERGIHIALRGIRGESDFSHEAQLASMNHVLDEEFDTLLMIPTPKFAHISSSLVREIILVGGEASAFVPDAVLRGLQNKKIR